MGEVLICPLEPAPEARVVWNTRVGAGIEPPRRFLTLRSTSTTFPDSIIPWMAGHRRSIVSTAIRAWSSLRCLNCTKPVKKC